MLPKFCPVQALQKGRSAYCSGMMPCLRQPRLLLVLLPLLALSGLAGCVSLAPAVGEVLPPRPAPAIERQAIPEGPACPVTAPRTLLVTGFPLRYPEQIPYGGYVAWPQVTAIELSRSIAQGKRVRTSAAPQHMLFDTPNAAASAAGWAREQAAQFVLSGSFRDFAVVPHRPLGLAHRHLVAEVSIRDGLNGAILAQREFAWKLPLSWELPRAADPGPGTREFAATRFGQLYHALLGEIAQWVEEEIICRPEPTPRPDSRDLPRLNF